MNDLIGAVRNNLITYQSQLMKPNNEWPPDVRNAVEFIHNNIYEDFNIGDLKKELNIHNKNFSDRFRYFIGKSPKNYVLNHRVNVSSIILKDKKFKKVKIIDLAFHLGFNSHAAFTVSYKKITGCTPTEWRQIYEKN